MLEPDLKTKLDSINKDLNQINKKTGSLWRAFFTGMLSGLGSVIGAAIAVLVIGWILNRIGVIPSLKNQAGEWKQTLDNLPKFR